MNPLVLSHNRHAVLIECLAQRAEPLAASKRFALYRLDPPGSIDTEPEIVIVHDFARDEIDNNIGYYVAEELLPLLDSNRQADFEHLVGAIVRSIDSDERRAWHLFYANSLAALTRAMAEPEAVPDFIWPFGAIYARVLSLVCGDSLLDAGTCFGFLPLLYAGQKQDVVDPPRLLNGHALRPKRIVGCDLDTALVRLANDYARHMGIALKPTQVEFVVADILADDIGRLGTFDTVVALHVIEHLPAAQTERALANLWQLTQRRLIIGVPLEETPDPRFGHLQVFDQERLCALGQHIGAPYRYFEHHGGWLVIDRF